MSKLLNRNEAGVYLECSPDSISVWRSTGKHDVPGIRIGKEIYYRRSDLDAIKAEIHGRPGARKANP